MAVRVKICGLTRPGDAAAAAELGAWALGVIFAPESPRCVDAATAAAVFERVPAAVKRVGVFVNADPGEVAAAATACRLDAVQLHGDEDIDYCRAIKQRTGCAVIRAFRVSDAASLADVVRFDTDYLLLDTYRPGRRGGTGETFDWDLASSLPPALRNRRVILSGGITSRNAAAAVRQVRPFALDVSSGVERSPGVKDEAEMKRLFSALEDEE